jgi:hypothetical protein
MVRYPIQHLCKPTKIGIAVVREDIKVSATAAPVPASEQ